MGCRTLNIGGHEVIQPYNSCPDCGEDMQSVVFVGLVCWNCYDRENQSEESKGDDKKTHE